MFHLIFLKMQSIIHIKEFKTKNPVSLVNLGYLKEEYDKIAVGLENEPERGLRCLKCYELRLEKSF